MSPPRGDKSEGGITATKTWNIYMFFLGPPGCGQISRVRNINLLLAILLGLGAWIQTDLLFSFGPVVLHVFIFFACFGPFSMRYGSAVVTSVFLVNNRVYYVI